MNAEDDLIQRLVVERPPNWSENLILTAFDRSSGLSVYVHMSRMAPDADIWEGVLTVFLPDGEHLLVSRTFGSDSASSTAKANAASSGNLVFSCEVPLEKWGLRYDGMVRRITTATAARAPVTDGPVERFSMELSLTGLHEAWVMNTNALAKQSWGSYHLEQACRIQGRVVIGGAAVPIDCTGFRDHTYGARTYGPLTQEAWVNCTFPSGRTIMALRVEEAGSPALTAGFIDDAVIQPVTMAAMPPLTSANGTPAEVQIIIAGEQLRTAVTVVQSHAMAYRLQSPVGFSLGVSTENPEAVVLVEGPAIFDWQGERGFGWLERLRRVRDLQNSNAV